MTPIMLSIFMFALDETISMISFIAFIYIQRIFSQAHQMMMVGLLRETNQVFTKRIQTISSAFISEVDPMTAVHMAQAQLYGLLRQQAVLWGYVETFRYYAVAVILILPFVCLLDDNTRKKEKMIRTISFFLS